MSSINWTRAAYLFFTLAVLAALARLGSPEAATRSFILEQREETTAVAGGETATQETRQVAATVSRPGATSSAHVGPGDRGDRHHDAPSRVFSDAAKEDGPPVFYRPAARAALGSPAVAGRASGPICGDLGNVPKSSRIVFPLPRGYFSSYEDTWGAPRPQGGHEGADLMAPFGTPEYAITDGTVVPVSGANGNGWNTLGGYTVMVEAAYSIGPVKKGDLFYYAHMDRESTLPIGTKVRAGQVVGYAGDTGEGPEGTRGLMPSHLHLGWYDTTGARTDLASGAMNPFPLLEWIKANGGAVRGGSDARYCRAPQTGAPTPSTGERYWPFPSNPGVRPDISTGSSSPKPSPVVEKAPGSAEHDPAVEKEPPANKPSPQTNVVEKTSIQRESVRAPETGTPAPRPPSRGEVAAPDGPDAAISRPVVTAGEGWKPKVRHAVDRVRDRISRQTTPQRPKAGDRRREEPGAGKPAPVDPARPGAQRPKERGCEPARTGGKEARDPCRGERSVERTAPVEGTRPPAPGGETTAPEETTGQTTDPGTETTGIVEETETTVTAAPGEVVPVPEDTTSPEETTGG